MTQEPALREVRCPNCQRLIAKYRLEGKLEIESKCPRCHAEISRKFEQAEQK
jgi:phage FluMu protein Com